MTDLINKDIVIFNLKKEIEDKEFLIEDLKSKLNQEISVKKSEVMLNQELQERIEKLELHRETLVEINEKYSDTISKLRARLKELIVKS
jgi:chaperonin cofactor prefoldin